MTTLKQMFMRPGNFELPKRPEEFDPKFIPEKDFAFVLIENEQFFASYPRLRSIRDRLNEILQETEK